MVAGATPEPARCDHPYKGSWAWPRADLGAVIRPAEFWPGMSVIGKLGIGFGEGVLGGVGIWSAGMSSSWLAGGPFSDCRNCCRGTGAQQVADRHQSVAVGPEHRDELVHQIDGARVGVMEQHNRARLDIGHQHVPRRRRVRVVSPVERDDVPSYFGQAVAAGGLAPRPRWCRITS